MSKSLLLGGTVIAACLAAVPADAASRANRTTGTEVSGTMAGAVCRAGYQTKVGDFIPPDFSTDDNSAAATVTLKKSCSGAIVAQLTAESWVVSGGKLAVDFYATCTGTGGFSGACTIGQKVKASPGDNILLENQSDNLETHSSTMIFKNLKKGIWRVDAVPGGDGASGMDYRTFFVQAFKGG